MKLRFFIAVLFSIAVYFTCLDLAVASSADINRHGHPFCGVTDWQPDSRRYARTFAANLNVGEPRTVRMIYFLPNDRPYRAEVVQQMKDEISNIQTFYAEQMEAHGYGKQTFRFETDADGEPMVHRVDGRHPDSHYLDDTPTPVFSELAFDINKNVYLVVVDNSINSVGTGGGGVARGVGGGAGKQGGQAMVSGSFDWILVAHELGHAFGLQHDFRDRVYIMSYGNSSQPRLSACNADFLSVHPYFNAAIPIEAGPLPTIELLSSLKYPVGSMSVSVQLKLSDAEGLHQVFLLAEAQGGGYEVWGCRGLAGVKDAEIEFDYDGYSPSHADWGRIRRLSDQDRYGIIVMAIDIAGNVNSRYFELSEEHAPEGRRASIIEIISGDSQQGTPLALLPNPLIVEVRDQNGQPLPDNRVQFVVMEGDARLNGKLYAVNVMTNNNGRAEQTLTLGSNPGTNIIRVWTPEFLECEPVIITAIAVGVPSMSTMDGDSQMWSLPNGATARLGKGLINPEGDRTVSFSPNGHHVAVASGIGIWLYDVETLRESALLEHRSPVLSVSFSRDGSMLASGLNDGKILLWDVATRQNVGTFEGHEISVISVSFSSDGSKLASGDYFQTVKLWEVATTHNIATWQMMDLDFLDGGISVALAPDGSMLVSGSEGRVSRTLRLWNVATKDNFSYLEGHRLGVNSVAFSPDGETIASGSLDGDVKLWNVSTEQNIATLRAHSGSVTSVVFSLDGSTLASGSRDSVYLWDVATKDNVGSLVNRQYGDPITSVSLSPNGKVLASASESGIVALWDLETRNATTFSGLGHVDVGASVSFSRDGKLLASSGEDGIVKLWDVETGRNTKSLGLLPWGIDVVSFSPDGTMVAAGGPYNIIDLWHVPTSTKIDSFGRGEGGILSLAWSRDGTTLAAGDPAGLVLWNVVAGTYISTPLGGHTGWVGTVAFSPDGTTVVSGEADWNGKVTLWDAATLSRIATLDHRSLVLSAAFSRNGDTLAVAFNDGVVALWDMATLSRSATVHSHGVARDVAFSPDGKILASGTSTGMVTLWDVETEATIATLEGHAGGVRSVSYSHDGMRLASGSADGTILLWDLQSPQLQSLELENISGNNQEGLPGEALEKPFVVEVQDESNNPLPGVEVTFSVTAGGGTLSVINVATDSNGRAKSVLTLGPNPGENTVTVSVTGIQEQLTFSAVGNLIRENADFTLSIPAGTHAIHIPLDVVQINGENATIDSVGDLYDALGDAVNLIVTISADGGFVPYLGNDEIAGMAPIGDDTGLIVGLRSAVTLELVGDALGTGGDSSISIAVGNNLVGVPLDPGDDMMISDLLVEGVAVIAVSKASGEGFHTIQAAGDEGDGPLTGGVGYLVVATAETSIPILRFSLGERRHRYGSAYCGVRRFADAGAVC